jgi:putative adenylate-forming enzyme
MMRVFWLLLSYWRTRRLRFGSRAALEAYQAQRMRAFLARLCAHSPYFKPFCALPLAQWPTMDKALMIARFDSMNTASLVLDDAMAAALQAERSRDFKPAVNGITVGLSSGTSSQRAVFAVSEREKATWAGVMLAKALPAGLFSGQRVALFLRANSNLYEAVRTPWLQFAFFDLFQPFRQLMDALQVYRPSVVVAPAQVLRELALAKLAGSLAVTPLRVISVAEVLEPQDRVLIERAFGQVHEIYQATEGFLASTCERGVLHLNEEHVHVEPVWLDQQQRRFVPLITDFSRMTQPIVRYRLDDILVARAEPCPCGRVTRAIERIEGRCDDMLSLPGTDGQPVPVFADLLARALAQALPADADYRLRQTDDTTLALSAAIDSDRIEPLRLHLEATLAGVGIDVARLCWNTGTAVPTFDPVHKRRRIMRERT